MPRPKETIVLPKAETQRWYTSRQKQIARHLRLAEGHQSKSAEHYATAHRLLTEVDQRACEDGLVVSETRK